jgi:hypothetical protein
MKRTRLLIAVRYVAALLASVLALPASAAVPCGPSSSTSGDVSPIAAGQAIPFDIHVMSANSGSQRFGQTPAVWKAEPRMAETRIARDEPTSSLSRDGGLFMHSNLADNGGRPCRSIFPSSKGAHA